MKKVVVLGGVSYDSIIRVPQLLKDEPSTVFVSDFYEQIGGTGSGKAFNAKRLGFETYLYSFVGVDYYFEMIMKEMQEEGIHFIYNYDTIGTERHTNIISDQGERISMFTVFNGDMKPVLLDRLEPMIIDADIVWLNIMNYCRAFIPMLKNHNKKIWVDLHDYDGVSEYHQEFLECADYVFISSDRLEDYYSFMEKCIQDGKEFVVCTHGKKGATLLTKDYNRIDVSSIEDYNFIDSNGAGDAFSVGFMYAYLKGLDSTTCMNYASIVAGLAITSKKLYSEELSVEFLESEYKRLFK